MASIALPAVYASSFRAPARAAAPGADDAWARLDQAMERYVDGDTAAFDELYKGVAPRIYRYLVVLAGAERAQDLLQTTFMRLHAARDGWIRGARVKPYVYAIARHAAFDELRKRARCRVFLTPTGELESSAECPGEEKDEHPTARIDEALRSLPPRYREAIVLTKYQDLSHREAGLVVGASETAMKLRAHRGYELLRARLAELRSTPQGRLHGDR
jgi:RNA polymerase sigma-70 factor (ECF subfamily)